MHDYVICMDGGLLLYGNILNSVFNCNATNVRLYCIALFLHTWAYNQAIRLFGKLWVCSFAWNNCLVQ